MEETRRAESTFTQRIPIESQEGIEIKELRGSRIETPVDSMGSHLDTPPSDEALCCLVRCFNFMKEQILSFFGWLCSCLVSKPATKEEREEVRVLLEKETETTLSNLYKRYSVQTVTCDSYLARCILVDSFKIAPLLKKLRTLSEPFDEQLSDETDPITQRQLQSKKNEILSVMEKLNDFSSLEKHPIARDNTQEMQEKVEEFSLEKLQLFDGDRHDTLKETMEILYYVTKNIFGESLVVKELIPILNGIRAKKSMKPLDFAYLNEKS